MDLDIYIYGSRYIYLDKKFMFVQFKIQSTKRNEFPVLSQKERQCTLYIGREGGAVALSCSQDFKDTLRQT